MKQLILTTAIILLVFGTFGQNKDMTKSYIFKTYAEYKQNKPSVTLDHEKGDKIKYSFPAGLQTRLKIKSDDSVTIYKPGDIWGYMEKGVLFRQFSNYKQKDLDWEFMCYFQVIYNKEIIVYEVQHSESGSYRGAKDYTLYYYSLDLNSDIKKINDENLNTDFRDKPEIIKMLNEFLPK